VDRQNSVDETGNGSARFLPLKGNSFRFRCHRHISCFTKCCANLNLVLTPYDILRVKGRLGMSSDEFLERYTETRIDPQSRFPKIVLKMDRDNGNTCPFVNPKGCTIYEDRPGACRIYPLGRGVMKVDQEKEARRRFFIVEEGHCLGFEEDKEWTVEEWMADQGLAQYNAMNDRWSEIMTSSKRLGPEAHIPHKLQMFAMASYNLDRFREFLFKSRFFELFELPQNQKDRLEKDDLALLEFSVEWLKFSLFGEKTIDLRKALGHHKQYQS